MSDALRREWLIYLRDMIDFINKIQSYTHGLTKDRFADRGMTYDAILRNLELIGEAAGHIPVAIRSQRQEIPWRMIIATRNRIIHGYLGIDDDILWGIIQEDLPELLEKLRKLEEVVEA